MGLDEICFTDHVDYGVKKDWDEPGEMLYRKGGFGEPEQMALANVDYPAYYETILRLKKEYSEKININKAFAFFPLKLVPVGLFKLRFAALNTCSAGSTE